MLLYAANIQYKYSSPIVFAHKSMACTPKSTNINTILVALDNIARRPIHIVSKLTTTSNQDMQAKKRQKKREDSVM